MLRFLSSYLFQNENQPNENDPTSITSSEQHDGPSSDKQPEESKLEGGASGKEEFMDLEMRDEGDDDEDDWVLIGENKRREEEKEEEAKRKEVKEDDLRVQVQPEVSLVAAPSTEEEDEDEEDDEEESEDEEEDAVEEQGLLWENKLIEHPSMSVYVDLATSISSNGVTASCISLSSIAPATSPGESVIVLEQPDSDEEDEEEDDESMDFLDSVIHEPMPLLQTAEQVHLDDCDDEDLSDTENNSEVPTTTPAKLTGKPVAATPPIQNGRRKKGHYPCTSSNSTQMPRRAHLRSCGGSNTSTSTTSFINFTNGAPDAPNDAIKRIKRSGGQQAASTGVSNANSVSACGIAVVNGGAASPASPPNSNGMINKNLKLVEMFPTATAAAKRRHRRNSPPQKQGATSKGHFLQEGRRRQDNQNYTKHSFANNDRRSATQRRVQKNAGGAGATGGRAK